MLHSRTRKARLGTFTLANSRDEVDQRFALGFTCQDELSGPVARDGRWSEAAKQASLLGMRGIAFSTPVERDAPKFEKLKPFVKRVLEIVLPATELNLVNVNLPEEPQGIEWTSQSVRHYDGRVVAGQDPMGREHHWITVVPMAETEEGTDRWAVSQARAWCRLRPFSWT